MEDTNNSSRKNIARMGFHYYQDMDHFTEKDLSRWLPELESLGAAWLVIQSAPDRAIPEPFIRGLLQSGIEPIVQMQVALFQPSRSNPASGWCWSPIHVGGYDIFSFLTAPTSPPAGLRQHGSRKISWNAFLIAFYLWPK